MLLTIQNIQEVLNTCWLGQDTSKTPFWLAYRNHFSLKVISHLHLSGWSTVTAITWPLAITNKHNLYFCWSPNTTNIGFTYWVGSYTSVKVAIKFAGSFPLLEFVPFNGFCCVPDRNNRPWLVDLGKISIILFIQRQVILLKMM